MDKIQANIFKKKLFTNFKKKSNDFDFYDSFPSNLMF